MLTKCACAAAVVAIAVCSVVSTAVHAQQAPAISIRVLSSPADMVSGGDALIEVRGVTLGALTMRADGRDVTAAFHAGQGANSVVGLVEGLREGKNVLQARAGGSTVTLEVTNYPITGPIVSGPALTPYVCTTQPAGLGEPLDANCSARTIVEYFYKARSFGASDFKPLKDLTALPNDVAQITTSTGQRVPTSFASRRARSIAPFIALRSSTIRGNRNSRGNPAPAGIAASSIRLAEVAAPITTRGAAAPTTSCPTCFCRAATRTSRRPPM
jgi:hypothetical protein